MKKNKRPQILAYYFPNWHVDPRNEKWHGDGWTEWNVTKCATPRFPGHKQPKVPLWGYEDEADPAVMEKKIETAVAYGIDGFMFDWYYYADGPYRNRCLEEGLLRASNLSKIKFAVMWCNHNAMLAHPASLALSQNLPVICSGTVNPATFREATQYCIDHYFSNPSYLRVDGKLVFSIYSLREMVANLGGETSTRMLFDDFRNRVRQAGLGELHLNAVNVGYRYEKKDLITADGSGFDIQNAEQVNALTSAVGLDSRSGHIFSWFQPDFPGLDYEIAAEQNIDYFRQLSLEFNLPYNPSVMVGSDPSPRTVQSDNYTRSGYPFLPILTNATPEQFEKILRKTRDFIESGAFTGNFLMLHSWNEWTEGAYLEPDAENGYGYLEAIRRVFGQSKPS